MTAGTLPPPLMPPEVDLRDFRFMPLDVQRLRDCRFVAVRPAEEVVAGILLWSASWHQVPASSLPDDDVELSQLAGYGGMRGLKLFQAVQAGALYGFVRCSDGRWYHPVVAEKAAEAWNAKLDQAHYRACDRIRKDNADRKERGESEVPKPAKPVHLTGRKVDGFTVFRQWNEPPIPPEHPRRSDGKTGHSDRNGPGDSGGNPAESTPKGREGTGKGQGQGQGQGIKDLSLSELPAAHISPAPVPVDNSAAPPAPADAGKSGAPPVSATGATTPAVAMAVELRRRGVNVTSNHPTLVELVDKGVTIPQAIEALEIALQRKVDESVSIGYLAAIVRGEILNPKPSKANGGGWWIDERTCEAEAGRLGIGGARPGESLDQFKARISAARAKERQRSSVP